MPHAALLPLALIAAAQAPPPPATHAKFLALIIALVAVFLGGLAVLTVARMVRRRHASREDRIAKVRSPSITPMSPWKAAGARARPDPHADDGASRDRDPADSDNADGDADPDDPFGDDFEPTGYDDDGDDDFDPDADDDDDLEDTDDGPAFR